MKRIFLSAVSAGVLSLTLMVATGNAGVLRVASFPVRHSKKTTHGAAKAVKAVARAAYKVVI